MQGVMTIITFAPALGQGHPGSGASSAWAGPWNMPIPFHPLSETRGRGGIILFKIHFFSFTNASEERCGHLFQLASEGLRHMSTQHVAGVRGGGDSCTRSPSPKAPPPSVCGFACQALLPPAHIPPPGWELGVIAGFGCPASYGPYSGCAEGHPSCGHGNIP